MFVSLCTAFLDCIVFWVFRIVFGLRNKQNEICLYDFGCNQVCTMILSLLQ